MPRSLQETLTPEKALIFRATHRLNLPWVLANGLHSRSSDLQDPGFVAIGNAEIIARRRRREVPIAPGGDLADYVLLRRRDFKRDENDLGKLERYQAEALAYQRVPKEALMGVACYTEEVRHEVEAETASSGISVKVVIRPDWYFR